MSNKLSHLPHQLKKLRKDKNLTQEQLASALGVGRTTITSWEKGTSLPDVITLIALAKYFGITLDELVTGNRPKALSPAGNPGNRALIDALLRQVVREELATFFTELVKQAEIKL
jgi:transcriptional regulator with XRE-family HTH domain